MLLSFAYFLLDVFKKSGYAKAAASGRVNDAGWRKRVVCMETSLMDVTVRFAVCVLQIPLALP